jgi:hypothetical protein
MRRRIAANIAKLPDSLGGRAPVEEQRRLYGGRPPDLGGLNRPPFA